MNNKILSFAAITSAFYGNRLDAVSNPDTSVDRKRRKERARMLTMQRLAELKDNPKKSKKRLRNRSGR